MSTASASEILAAARARDARAKAYALAQVVNAGRRGMPELTLKASGLSREIAQLVDEGAVVRFASVCGTTKLWRLRAA